MNPRDAIADLENMGFEITLLPDGSVHYRRRSGTTGLSTANIVLVRDLLDYLSANKPGMISVLERRDAEAPGELVKIELVGEYLKQHGYRVVRASWPANEPRPLLIVADNVT